MIDILKKTGRFFVLSAPSGAGKSTVKNLVMRRLPELVYSVSYTTRQPRPGEVNGRDYNFVTEAEFRAMIERGEFYEWAEVFGRFYGTGRRWVESRLAEGRDVLADLDVVGAAAVKEKSPEATLVFMAPPSARELERRLAARNTEGPEESARRLAGAKAEINSRHIFDFLLINDSLEKVVDDFMAIIEEGRGQAMPETEDFWQKFCEAL